MAIESILTTGLENFKIDIGQVGFFKGLMKESGLNEEQIEEVREFIDEKNLVGVEHVMNKHKVKDSLKKIILDLSRLFGSREILQSINYKDIGATAANALQNIKTVFEILEERKLDKYVSVDLGMVQSLNYYTGIVFRGYTYGVGFPILSGGRYDGLVSKFGRDCEATGFSLGINMVMMALERQKRLVKDEEKGVFITYHENARIIASDYRLKMISKGIPAQLDIMQKGIEAAKKYALQKGFSMLINIKEDGSEEEVVL